MGLYEGNPYVIVDSPNESPVMCFHIITSSCIVRIFMNIDSVFMGLHPTSLGSFQYRDAVLPV